MSNVGRLIHRERLAREQTIKAIAVAIGRSHGYICDIERGAVHGTPNTLRAIAVVLGVQESRMRDAYMQDKAEAAQLAWVHNFNERQYRNKPVELEVLHDNAIIAN